MPVDDLIDALLSKLGEIDSAWAHTFPPIPAGYRKVERLMRTYGYGNVKEALQYAIDVQLKPDNPMGFLVSTLNQRFKIEDVPVQEGML